MANRTRNIDWTPALVLIFKACTLLLYIPSFLKLVWGRLIYFSSKLYNTIYLCLAHALIFLRHHWRWLRAGSVAAAISAANGIRRLALEVGVWARHVIVVAFSKLRAQAASLLVRLIYSPLIVRAYFLFRHLLLLAYFLSCRIFLLVRASAAQIYASPMWFVKARMPLLYKFLILPFLKVNWFIRYQISRDGFLRRNHRLLRF